MSEIFGDFIEMGNSQEFLVISFSPNTLPIQERWRNNSLSADFLADYWGTFFPVHDGSSQHQRAEVRDAVSYIANELLENSIKFNHPGYESPISIYLYLSDNTLRFYVRNSVAPRTVTRFQDFIRKLLTEDPDELYIQQLENNADGENDDNISGLGFLTMLNDYNCRLAWKFETDPEDPNIITVITMVRLPIVRTMND